MLKQGFEIYKATRKKNDQVFNHYFMRVLSGYVVSILAKTPATPNQITILNLGLFAVAAVMFVALPSWTGGLAAVLMLEVSYLFDCADGMLARHKKLASKTGHLFDFFTDEVKALLLVGSIGLRLYRSGGYGPDLTAWSGERFLLATIAGVFILASATSLTNFVRRPELTGKEQSVEAYYETISTEGPKPILRRLVGLGFTFLRFLNHYPSHIYLWALAGRLDAFFFVYIAINLLYLAQGWLGLLVRFGLRDGRT
ncbi:MAG TPA: CDP-alcohol phosphatidyltransferase family protein [Polyangiaceae bacterium]|nr:CDP-alcohol phosphatidyltransferase family protein [Polyangiaceae bacterium]